MAILCGMDELVIEDKKYISTKRAAKETGYAKDYVGQLCREGRVPARLVGRSWYVLAAAIQDHRFGAPQDEEEAQESATIAQSASILPPTWQAPRYSSGEEPIMPTVNRLQRVEIAGHEAEESEKPVQNAGMQLHEAWKEWFSLREQPSEAADEPETAAAPEEEGKIEEEPAVESEPEEVPIHAIHHAPVTLRATESPIVSAIADASGEIEEELPIARSGRLSYSKRSLGARLALGAGMLVAVVSLAVAVVGSGYADAYLTSSSQANVIAGVSIYNK